MVFNSTNQGQAVSNSPQQGYTDLIRSRPFPLKSGGSAQPCSTGVWSRPIRRRYGADHSDGGCRADQSDGSMEQTNRTGVWSRPIRWEYGADQTDGSMEQTNQTEVWSRPIRRSMEQTNQTGVWSRPIRREYGADQSDGGSDIVTV